MLAALADPDGQDRMRTHLHEQTVTAVEQGSRRGVEPYGLPQVAIPVLGVEVRRVGRLAGHRGVERNPGRAGRDAVQALQQLVADGLHVV
jgi:hypothetical protein